ncbi:MAG: hypothetical protein NTW16_12895 [Bacteroidetes bacterium]|nr:hypothetical protein [Bacteroidota bacterium]
MAKKQVTVSIYVKEELKEKFEEVFRESEFNSKGEMFGILLETYLSPSETQDSDKSKQTIQQMRAQVAEMTEEIKEVREVNQEPGDLNTEPVTEGTIILPTTEDQAEILKKCYDDNDDFETEIVKDLVKMACQWVKVRNGGLFSEDEHTRLFALKGISQQDFEKAFGDELAAIEKEST